ncbi:MAG: bifunctional diaminohydroxyphosphoribosylaminopyrimidine deaminase/5-amino-6-(5-phosphoribosylamino)uracil reductase RibD [Actinobacteria bacterium]|nr:MAG: bifunctional diaminohydroxyphosphoribosylaminopyrimidine deaminase/5-amino-6-(5-phosphoribosylamino)uracil reductase RibD [Actinomycetota bacterium]
MTVRTETDRVHLARAIEIAERGRGRVSPNPLVGAVIARDGEPVAEGWHDRLGGPHAEREAIAAAGEADLRGATLYVSLEPCCHRGRTPPCTDAIVEAGIGRVVVGSDDPTEKASGRGLGILRDEGIEVEVAGGELAARARLLNQPFRKHARTGRPWVMFKAAMSLDGKVATESGDSKWISGQASRDVAHRWRAELDAVAVGVGTALADDPRLTARLPDVHRQPRRVVFDSTARLPVSWAGDVTSMLLEGGPHLAGAFLDAGEIDELRLFLAPLVLGGRAARATLEGEGAETIADAVRALTVDCETVGDDLLVSARLREW